MIHASKIPLIMDQKDSKGRKKTFDIAFHKLSTGELIKANNVYMSSYFHRNGTLNIVFPGGETRKIRLAMITEFNKKEVFL